MTSWRPSVSAMSVRSIIKRLNKRMAQFQIGTLTWMKIFQASIIQTNPPCQTRMIVSCRPWSKEMNRLPLHPAIYLPTLSSRLSRSQLQRPMRKDSRIKAAFKTFRGRRFRAGTGNKASLRVHSSMLKQTLTRGTRRKN